MRDFCPKCGNALTAGVINVHVTGKAKHPAICFFICIINWHYPCLRI